jgi:alanine racemase
MDTITIDATALPPGALAAGDLVDLIGPRCDVDRVATQAHTIGYEMLTRLGRRFERVYRYGAAGKPLRTEIAAPEAAMAG